MRREQDAGYGSKLRTVNAFANWPATASDGFIFQFPAIIIGQIPLSLPVIIGRCYVKETIAALFDEVRWHNITRSNVIMPAF